jgi:hypothetical protein
MVDGKYSAIAICDSFGFGLRPELLVGPFIHRYIEKQQLININSAGFQCFVPKCPT